MVSHPLAHAINAELAKRFTALLKAEDAEEPRLVSLASRLEPEMRRRFFAAIQRLGDAVDVAALEDAVRHGRASAIETALQIERMAEALDPALKPSLERGFNVGAEVAHGALTDVGLVLRFDLVNPRAVSWVREHGAQLVTGLSDESRAAVRTTIDAAFTEGRDVRRTARALRDVLGLTEPQAQAVESFRSRLAADGAEAEIVDRRASRYAQAQLRQRAENVARTEIMTASNEGQQSLWEIARTQGLIDDQTQRRWIATPDELLCDLCEPLNGMEVGLREEFPGGYMNPPRHPSCRCTLGLAL